MIKELWVCFVASICINAIFHPQVTGSILTDEKASRPLATSSYIWLPTLHFLAALGTSKSQFQALLLQTEIKGTKN